MKHSDIKSGVEYAYAMYGQPVLGRQGLRKVTFDSTERVEVKAPFGAKHKVLTGKFDGVVVHVQPRDIGGTWAAHLAAIAADQAMKAERTVRLGKAEKANDEVAVRLDALGVKYNRSIRGTGPVTPTAQGMEYLISLAEGNGDAS